MKIFKTIQGRLFLLFFLMGLFPTLIHLLILTFSFTRKTNVSKAQTLVDHLFASHFYFFHEIFFTLLISFLASIYLAKPIQKVFKITTKVLEKKFHKKPKNHTGNEIKEIEETLKIMLNQLEINKKYLNQRAKKISESAKKHRELLNLFADVIYEVDINQKITKVKNSQKLFGFQEKDLIGTSSLDVVHPEDREKLQQKLKKINTQKNKSLRDIKVRILTKSGDFRYALLSTRSIFKNGKLIGREGVLRDITDREHLSQKVLHEKEKLETAYKNLNESYLALGKINAQIAALAEINTTFSSSLNWKEKLHYIIESIRIFMQADETILLIQDSKKQKFKFKNASLDSDFWKDILLTKRHRLAKEIIKNRKPVKYFNKELFLNRKKLVSKGYNAVLAIPIIINNEVVGIFVLFFSNAENLEKSPTNLTLAYTSQMSIALMMSKELDLNK